MISVCIPTYNGEKYICQQLQSILPQLSEIDEVIVSDDRSTDRTLDIVKSFNDSRVKIYTNTNNQGVVFNIENALMRAKGTMIFLSDQDDVWIENKVETCLQYLTSADLVVSDCYVTDESLNIVSDSFYEINKSKFNRLNAFVRNPYLGCCIAFNSKVLNDILPFPKKIPMHDIWIGNVAAFVYQVKFIPEKLIYYRRHTSNSSTASSPTKASVYEQFKYRFYILVPLLKLVFKQLFKKKTIKNYIV